MQEKFKRGFRRLFRRCRGPLGRDRRFSSSAGEVSLSGAFHVEAVDGGGGTMTDRTTSRRRIQRGSDASSINYYDRQDRQRSVQLTPVSVHHHPQSPQLSRSSSGTHLTVSASVRYRPVNSAVGSDDVEL